jgi:HK97 family phage portal protein
LSKKRGGKKLLPTKPAQRSSAVWITDAAGFDSLCTTQYRPLDRCPEIVTACSRIADLIATMTIYLMANTKNGDERIVNELSRKVDIEPTSYMTRHTWMTAIVMNMLLYGRGNAVVVPHTTNGLLGDLEPVTAERVGFIQDGRSYKITIDGVQKDPADLLHFVYRPDKYQLWRGRGVTLELRDVARNLGQASDTIDGFLDSKWKPSVIVKVDALTEEFSSPEGRQKLLNNYLSTAKAGEPWMIPAEQFAVDQVRPLSLKDLAISEVVELDKRTVASIIGVPAFILGVGEYSTEEWNNFVDTTIYGLAQSIQQELTKKLLISPKMYWKFNMRSLHAYNLQELATVYKDLRAAGVVDGNEVRDALGMEPREGLDELVMLENYIPTAKLGDQLKLKQGGNEDGN